MTPPEQLPLGLSTRPALGREAFAVTDANRDAVTLVEAWPDWPGRKLALAGPEGSGKTHLAHVWAALAGGQILEASALPAPVTARRVAVENVPAIAGNAAAEEALFHLHNRILGDPGGCLLVTGTDAPVHWPIQLPDLASRMQGMPSARLGPPDDVLLAHLLLKLFNDRGVVPPRRLVDFLVPRMERSFAEAQRLVAEIDRRALADSRPIGLELAKDVLAQR